MSVPGQLVQWMSMFEDTKVQAETAYWNYAGNLSDNMANTNAANAGWWQFKWYGDLRGDQTVQVDSDHRDKIDSLQGIGALDSANHRGTVLYGGANDENADQVKNTGANIPVTVQLTGLDKAGFGSTVDVEVHENAFTGPDGIAATPRVVNALSNVQVRNGTLDVTTTSVDRYASYQLVVTPHQDRSLRTDDQLGRNLQVTEAERTKLSGGARAYDKTPSGNGWSYFMTSGNGDVGNFKDGATADWEVQAPADGKYRLQVISGNTGFPGTNKVSVDSKAVGELDYHAELAMKDAAKWLYRGSTQLEMNLTQGRHIISIHGSTALDNTLDKFLLYRIPEDRDGTSDAVDYPATQFRLAGGASLDFSNEGSRGFAELRSGHAHAFIHGWSQGYHTIKLVYRAAKGTPIALNMNGKTLPGITAAYSGLQSTSLEVALSEGINSLDLSGTGVSLRDVQVAASKDLRHSAISLQAEDQQLNGGASAITENSSNAENHQYVIGLGNQFTTAESGPAGYGDRTRVVVENSNNRPKVNTHNPGIMTIPAGTVPRGDYMVAVRFSNDAFIGRHDYNPQIVDLGLQIRQGDGHGPELARGSFRYTYSDRSFLNRSLQVSTNGGALSLGNWDPAGTGRGAVSWGVAPNIDSLIFYPEIIGTPTSEDLESHPSEPGSVTIHAPGLAQGRMTLRKGQKLQLTATDSQSSSDAAITWSTSDPRIATVDPQGMLSALEVGNCTITASSGSASSSFRLQVIPATSADASTANDSKAKPRSSAKTAGQKGQEFRLSSTGSAVTLILLTTIVLVGTSVLTFMMVQHSHGKQS